jgi:hypothetical protein
MKPQFQHQVTTSFALWADNYLMSKGEAYTNYTGAFYYTEDARLPEGKIAYNSPHKQWVFDANIDGAFIPTGIYDEGGDMARGTNGLSLDFDNGRAILDSAYGTTKTTVSGSYAVKDFNVYITSQTEEQLIIENKYDTNSRFKQELSGISPYSHVIPAIFINIQDGQNQPYAFGGEDKTNSDIRCVIFAENSYQLDGALSIFNDSKHEVFKKLGFEDYPMQELGEVTGFNYKTLIDGKNRDLFFIENVRVSKLSDRVNKNIDPSLFMGFIDFEISNLRFPRQ